MNLKIFFFVTCLIVFPTCLLAEEKNEIPPIQNNWDKESDDNRSFSSLPSLFKDANSVHVYFEKQLDNVTIGIVE